MEGWRDGLLGQYALHHSITPTHYAVMDRILPVVFR